MFFVRFFIFLFLSGMFLPSPARAVKSCAISYSEMKSPLTSFWLQNEAVTVAGKNQKQFPLTFSFDSEVSLENTYRYLISNPESEAWLKQVLEAPSEGLKAFLSNSSLSKPELANLLQVSERQFDRFVLRKGIDENKASFFLLDLNPSYLHGAYFNHARHERNSGAFLHELQVGFKTSLIKNGFPVSLHMDAANFEITHASSERIPAQFRKLVVEGLHTQIKNPQTHLHIGLPEKAITNTKALEITRAVETKIILELAEGWEPGTKELAFVDGTSLRADPGDVDYRGVVRLGYSEFSKPVKAHNLEIRQWDTIEGGLENLALAAEMAKRHREIKVVKMHTPVVDDPYTSSLLGALEYSAVILARSGKSEEKKLAKKLLALHQKGIRSWENERENSEFRTEVKKFLLTNNIRARLTLDSFLR